MNLAVQIARYMSLREPQREALEVLEAIGAGKDYRTMPLHAIAAVAGEKSRPSHPVEFDTEFPSFCFALATGVGKTRLMGAMMYHLWRSKDYRNFFILAPNITIYDKLRAELSPVHPKYMFTGLSDFPRPDVYDGDNYLRYNPAQLIIDNRATVFIFNIGKIFTARTDTDFKFHRFNETLGNSFSAVLQGMDDLMVLMDESHRYRGEASLTAINHLKPVLGLEFTATPLKKQKNVVYSFGLAQAIGRFVKTPTVVTRTNLTVSDAQEIERLKLTDGMTRHELKKGRLAEYCEANRLATVKPFVLISTRDTTHASEVRALIESDAFCDGRYRGKVIEIHSGKSGAESDENVRRLLSVEQPTSTVEIVIHVNMLKEGWDVNNLYTIIPLRASVSDILTEQTIERGLRLPFGTPTGDDDLDALEIMSHDQYAKLIEAAKGSPLFRFKELREDDLRPVTTVPVTHKFVDLEKVLDRLAERRDVLFTAELGNEHRLNEVVAGLVAEEVARYEKLTSAQAGTSEAAVTFPPAAEAHAQGGLFPGAGEAPAPAVFDPVALETDLKERLRNYVAASIDVPDIFTEALTDRKLEPFDVKVTVGPFELVDQRVLVHELGTDKERLGERLAVMEVDNPRAFLAGRLIDAVEELDVPNDKDTALALVDAYLARMGKPAKDLPKLVHLYRDAIIKDLKVQVEARIHDETLTKTIVRSGFVKFRGYSKTVLAREGVVHYLAQVPRGDIRKYLFEGFAKSLYPQAPFDSTPEKDFAVVLERDPGVKKWVRPPEGTIPIYWRGRDYNPDFIVEMADRKYMVEIKARRELSPTLDPEVLEKAIAAMRWCKAASGIEGSVPWEYKLIPDDVVQPDRDIRFVFGQAVRVML